MSRLTATTKTVRRTVKSKTETVPAKGAVVLTLDDPTALIPPMSVAHRYLGRKINGVLDHDILRSARKEGENVLVFGPTGAGKTMMLRAYCATEGLAFYPVQCSAAGQLSAYVGKMRMTASGSFVWQDGPLTVLARNGGVFYLNEVNALPPNLSTAFFGLTDERRQLTLEDNEGEIINVHPDFQIVADYNPDYRGTRPLNEAFKNRWAHKIHMDYDLALEKKLVVSDAIREMAAQLRAKVGTDIQTPISTNMLMEFERFTLRKGFGVKYAAENFVNAFDASERASVANIVKLKRVDIEGDLLAAKKSEDVEDVEDFDVEDIAFDIEV